MPKNKYDVNTGAYSKDAKARVDTSYVDNGVIINKTIERKLTSRRDLISTRIVNVYPDTIMWLRDFQYSYNDPKMRMYFSAPGYSNYPVVGVTGNRHRHFVNGEPNCLIMLTLLERKITDYQRKQNGNMPHVVVEGWHYILGVVITCVIIKGVF